MGVASGISLIIKKKYDSFIATSIKFSVALDTFGERGIELNGDIETLARYIKSIKNRNRLASVIF